MDVAMSCCGRPKPGTAALEEEIANRGIKTEADTTATAAISRSRLELSDKVIGQKRRPILGWTAWRAGKIFLVHVAAATMRHGRFFLLLWNLRNEGFGRQQESGNRRCVL